jgi:ankyrin repeat protein
MTPAGVAAYAPASDVSVNSAAERRTRVVLAALGCVVLAAASAYAGRARRDAQLAVTARGDLRAAKSLLAAGAHADARDASGRPLIEVAASKGGASAAGLVSALLAAGADPADAPQAAALRGRADVVRAFLSARPALGRGDSGGKLLCSAALGGNPATLRAVLAARPPLDWRAPTPAEDAGMTPVMFAARSTWPESVAALVAAGADRHVHTASGRTALMFAAQWNTPDALRALTKNGADRAGLNDRDVEGRTALMMAAASGRFGAVDYLLRLGANPNVKDRDGRTALALAAGAGDGGRVAARLRAAAAPGRAK